MKLSLGHALALALTTFASLAACTRAEPPKSDAPAPAPSPTAVKIDPVKRGEQLVTMGGCNDCHTPLKFDPALGMPVPQRDRMLSGHPQGAPDPGPAASPTDSVFGPTMTSMRLPFGVVYAANLTSDVETGLGGWTEEQFVRAVRTGHHKGDPAGRPILPPMPWQNLAGAPDEDLHAIFAFLKTVPAVSNKVPDPKVPPPAIEAIQKGYDAAREHASR